jgi:hypothetical protein
LRRRRRDAGKSGHGHSQGEREKTITHAKQPP